jgi:WD40 repeat protein
VSLVGLVLALILAGFALISRSQARTARNQAVTAKDEAVSARANAQSRALASESANQLPVDAERSLLLAMAAERSQQTPEATYALRRAIDLSPIRKRLPTVGQSFPQLEYSPDGRQLAEAYSPIDDTMTLVLFDARTLLVERRVRIPKEAGSHFISSHVVAYNATGSLLAVGTADAVVLIDPKTGKQRYAIPAMNNSHSLSFSPDGTMLAASQEDPTTRFGHAMVWNLRTRKLTRITAGPVAGIANAVVRVDFAPDGKRLLIGGAGGLGIVDPITGRLLARTLPGSDVGRAAEFSPDGSLILAGVAPADTAADPRLRLELRDARTLALRETIFSTPDGNRFVGSAHFSPDGMRVVYSAGHSFAVYSLATHRVVYETNVGAANYRSTAFSPDGRELAVSSDDGRGAVFRADGTEQAVIDVGASINTYIGVRPLALARDRVVATFSPRTGATKGLEVVKSWSWDGKPAARPLLLTRHNNFPWFGVDPLGRIAFTALTEDAQRWSTAKAFSGPSPMSVWDLAQRRVVKRPEMINGLAWLPTISSDGSHLLDRVVVSSAGQERLVLVDLRSGKMTLRAKAPCTRFGEQAVSGDGSLVAAVSACPDLLTWKITAAGPVLRHLPVAVAITSGPLAFSPDARQLAIANISGQGEVVIVDARSGKSLATLVGHTDHVVGAVFSPNGESIVTASWDGTARVWNTRTGRLLRTLDHPGPLAGLALSPDGRMVATLDGDGIIRLWDACTDCENPGALMALAKTRVTRGLTPSERATYLG